MRGLLALVITTLISLPATAENVWHNSTILDIYPLSDGSFVIKFEEPSPSCKASSNQHVVAVGHNSVTQEGLKLMFSAALAGAAAGKQVHIYFDSSSESCVINRLRVRY